MLAIASLGSVTHPSQDPPHAAKLTSCLGEAGDLVPRFPSPATGAHVWTLLAGEAQG